MESNKNILRKTKILFLLCLSILLLLIFIVRTDYNNLISKDNIVSLVGSVLMLFLILLQLRAFQSKSEEENTTALRFYTRVYTLSVVFLSVFCTVGYITNNFFICLFSVGAFNVAILFLSIRHFIRNSTSKEIIVCVLTILTSTVIGNIFMFIQIEDIATITILMPMLNFFTMGVCLWFLRL